MTRLLTDAQWAKIAPLLPKVKPSREGGRPRADDRACLEGILWVLRTGARWRDMPSQYPSGVTCWRRLSEWERDDVWLSLWRAFLSELDERHQLDWSEAFLDGTFAPAKKGALASAKHARVRGQSSWYWSTARVFLSECTFRLRISPRATSRKRPSRRSR
jgi:transposase